MAIEIVDLPIENSSGSFHSYVGWPEGMYGALQIIVANNIQ